MCFKITTFIFANLKLKMGFLIWICHICGQYFSQFLGGFFIVFITFWIFVIRSRNLSFISPVSMCSVASVVSDSLRPYGLQPARLLCPWGLSRQDYWSGLSCPPPGDLPHPEIKPVSLMSPGLAVRFFCATHKKTCHRWVDLNYVNLFSYTSGCYKSQIWVPGCSDSGETYTSRQLPSPHVLIWGESFGISSSSFKDTSSVRSGLHLITLFSLKLNLPP